MNEQILKDAAASKDQFYADQNAVLKEMDAAGELPKHYRGPEMGIKQAVDIIIQEIDKRTLLGAAYECMTEKGKEKFQKRLFEIIKEHTAVTP